MSDDVRLDLELAADAEIDHQIMEPKPIFGDGIGFVSGIQAVAYKNCANQKVPRGVFEARCVARGFTAESIQASEGGGNVGLDDIFFVRGLHGLGK